MMSEFGIFGEILILPDFFHILQEVGVMVLADVEQQVILVEKIVVDGCGRVLNPDCKPAHGKVGVSLLSEGGQGYAQNLRLEFILVPLPSFLDAHI
jgi:hypothetical protein